MKEGEKAEEGGGEGGAAGGGGQRRTVRSVKRTGTMRRQGGPPTVGSLSKSKYFIYSGCHENCSFSVHSYNQHYLSIPQYTGSWRNSFQETHGMLFI